ncbi:unnamed protein product [Ixodes pacificus]
MTASLPSPRTTPHHLRIGGPLFRSHPVPTDRSAASAGTWRTCEQKAESVLGALGEKRPSLALRVGNPRSLVVRPTAADPPSQRRTSRLGHAPPGLATEGSPASVAQKESEEEESAGTPLGGASTEQTRGTLLSAEVAAARTRMTPYG